MEKSLNAIHWFRKGLRLHDNPALIEACQSAKKLYPIFIIDPNFCKPHIIGVNRYNFLLESLHDLDHSLRVLGSRLFVVRGKPELVLPDLVHQWNINLITFESDTEPYAKYRDECVFNLFRHSNEVKISTFCSHTLNHPDLYLSKCKGNKPSTYQSFHKIFESIGPVPNSINSPSYDDIPNASNDDLIDSSYSVPTLTEMGYLSQPTSSKFKGGETEALKRLNGLVVSRPNWVAKFEKPNTSPNSLEPSTTVLSPYLKFGCLSVREFYHQLSTIYAKNAQHTLPPVSLHGQLLWREYFYFYSYCTPNFDKMEVSNFPCLLPIPVLLLYRRVTQTVGKFLGEGIAN